MHIHVRASVGLPSKLGRTDLKSAQSAHFLRCGLSYTCRGQLTPRGRQDVRDAFFVAQARGVAELFSGAGLGQDAPHDLA